MKKFFLCLIFLFLTGCTAANPVLDAMIGGISITQVEGYFDLDRKQEKDFERELNKDVKNIQRKQLQDFAQAIRQFDERVPHEKEDSKILSEVFEKLESEYSNASGAFKNSAVFLVNSLREEQFAHFEKQVRKEIQEARLDGQAPFNSNLQARFKKQIKYWVGPMSVHQDQMLKQFIDQEPFPWKERLDNREQILNRFMAERQDPKKLRQFTEQFMVDYDSLRTPEYARSLAAYEERFKGFLNKFWSTLNYEQKQQLQSSLNKQAQEVESLALNERPVK
ncbi:DUF6279 family lipoprotein [Bdellovibrio sp. HCB290]|uniref:DUF6279 family lipoprotein n=1 Tax=Bdellovibrio sp. HCB290 TaxID=3394356 RepID=UPI0039B65989